MTSQSPNQVEIPAVRLNPIAHGIRRHYQSQRPNLLATAVIAGSVAFAPAASSAQAVLEEIVVTATKRSQNMQDVPISLQALDSTKLTELGIQSFDDYALMLPSLSYKTIGPGLNTIYMRGVSDGGDGNPSGAAPSVGLYLDEQPVTSIASNLDVHIYDIARIEALAGPQGTLFGASAQAGVVRIISNQPSTDGFEARFDVGGMSTDGGDTSTSFEGMVNLPLGDKAALRLVGWRIDEGGYIDNVAGTRVYDLTGPYGYTQAVGRTGTIDNTNFVSDDPRANAEPISDDINTMEKTGLRALLKVDLSDDWTLTGGVLYQDMQTEGVWDHDPDSLDAGGDPIGNYKIQRYYQDTNDDEFTQFSLVLDGTIGDAVQLTYAGSLLDRQNEYINDYTEYGEVIGYVPYYACDYSATGGPPPGPFDDATDCTVLDEFVYEPHDMTRQTHELRISSLGDGAFSYTAGVFFNEFENDFELNYIQPHMAPSGTVISPGVDGTNLYFLTAQKRTDSQSAIFGELTYTINDQWSVMAGGRYYEYEGETVGVVTFGPTAFGVITEGIADFKVSADDFLTKFNVNWRPTENTMIYATRAEGYRPGGVNRDPASALIGFATFEQDFLVNLELGWKTTSESGRTRFNGAIFTSNWSDVQYTIYDFSLSKCCGTTYNLGNAEVKGVELDITVAASDRWTLFGGLARIDAKTVEDFVLDPSAGDPFQVPKGQVLPNVPQLKLNLSARYDWPMGNNQAYAQATMAYVSSTTNRIKPTDSLFADQDEYTIVNFRAGMLIDTWNVDLFVNNLTNTIANMAENSRVYGTSTIINRPRSIGVKVGKSF